MRDFNVTPHVAQNTTNRLSAIDGRTIRHCGYEVSQQKRKRVEEPFGWGKTIGGLARPMLPYSEILIFPRDGYGALWANFQQPARTIAVMEAVMDRLPDKNFLSAHM